MDCKLQSWKGNKTGGSVHLSQGQEAVDSVVRSFNKLMKYKCSINDHRILGGMGSQVVFSLSLSAVAFRGFEIFLTKNNGRTAHKWKNNIEVTTEPVSFVPLCLLGKRTFVFLDKGNAVHLMWLGSSKASDRYSSCGKSVEMGMC